MGVFVNWNMVKMLEETTAKREAHGRELEAERAAKAQLEAQYREEKATREREATERQSAFDRTQASLADANIIANQLRDQLAEREGQATQLREAAARTQEEHRTAVAAATAAARAEAEAAALARAPNIVTQSPTKPEKIDFEYRRNVNGLLEKVVLKAAGYEDVAIDVLRGGDNRMRQLKVGPS